MTSAGILLTRSFLDKLGDGNFQPKDQAKRNPSIYKRVKLEAAELRPSVQTVNQLYNIVRAHYETDPNSYVAPAYIQIGGDRILDIYKASLKEKSDNDLVFIEAGKNYGDEVHEIVFRANNGDINLILKDKDGSHLYLERVCLRLS